MDLLGTQGEAKKNISTHKGLKNVEEDGDEEGEERNIQQSKTSSGRKQKPSQEYRRKKMWLAFLVIRYLNIIIVLVFGKKRKNIFRKEPS